MKTGSDSGGKPSYHAAGRHSHVTELLRSGASLPEARELARHSDIRTTMKYTHIGMADRARALGNLRWPRIGSGARDVRGQSVASNGNRRGSDRKRVRFPPPPLCNLLNDNELPEQPSGMVASCTGISLIGYGATTAKDVLKSLESVAWHHRLGF
jgi:Phage integrase family